MKLIIDFSRALYHLLLAEFAAFRYGRPSRTMTVVGVTGTNGKSTTVELIASILEEAGFRTASASSVRFKIGERERPNALKMTMPGRGALQKFLRDAKKAGATHAVLEATSEGIRQSRHRGIEWDAFVLTNVTPEHIESHGSFEKYRAAKERLFAYLVKTHRKPNVLKIIVVNADDPSRDLFLRHAADKKITYSPKEYEVAVEDGGLSRQGRAEAGMRVLPPGGVEVCSQLTGLFNLANIAAAVALARALDIGWDAIRRGIETIEGVAGRMEYIQKEPFAVVVDYAHTPDALHGVYQTFGGRRLICVLGAAGGGRDAWKRLEFGRIASEFCAEIIVTNEDPYDEDPAQILSEIEAGISNSKIQSFKIVDRKAAIQKATRDAKPGDVVIITGKGCEPWMVGPRGSKIPWDDRAVAREALKK